MGNPRKPTHLKVVSGTARRDRVSANEPEPPRGVPEPPIPLSERAASVWPVVARILDDMGVLTTADGPAVLGLCETWAELQAAREALAARGSLTYATTTERGEPMHRAFPEAAMAADADRRFRMWLAAVGMTPADRSRVSADKNPDENPFAALG